MKNKKQPTLRYSDYSDEWKTHVLRDVVERVTRKNKGLESQLPLTISAQYGLVDQISYFNKQVASKDMSNYFLLKRGEFAYNKSYSRDYPWGAIKRLDKYDMGALSSLYITFKPYQIDSNFLVSYYDTTKWHKEVSTRATEGARNHGLLNISANDFLDTEIFIPSQKEQEKIGSFFKQIDEAIALQQQELETLKQTKQGFLQKMFPKEGEFVPEFRFDEFNEDWSLYKLGDLGSTFTGLSGKTKEDFGRGSAEFVTYMNVFSNPISNLKMTENVEIDSKQNALQYGDVLFTTSSETPREVGMSSVWLDNRENVYLNSFCFGFRPTFNVNPLYLAYMLRSNSIREQMILLAQGISRYNISKTKVMDILVKLPSEKEQIKIGEFFKKLDKTIELQEKELEALKETKKAFLQKMFV